MTFKMYRPAEFGRAEANIDQGFTIREMRPGEEVDWAFSCLSSFDIESVTPEYYEKMMAHDDGVRMCDVFFACKDDKPVGTATAKMEKGEPFLHFVAVNPDFRGHKLAQPLIAVKSYLNLGFLPVLFEDGVREGWEKELRLFGIKSVKAYNADMTPAEDIVAY